LFEEQNIIHVMQSDYYIFNQDGTDLRKVQLRMLEMLIEIDKICRKHAIPYWLSSGTALGAVRHGGFIPWDDDLDIEILHKDYKKLLRCLQRELPKTMFVQTSSTDKHYFQQYAKVRDLRTRIMEKEEFASKHLYNGIFVDIFPMERTSEFIKSIASKLYGPVFKMASSKKCNYRFLHFYLFFLEKIVFPFFRLFSFLSSANILRHAMGVGFSKYRIKEDIFPLKELEFEGHKFFGASNMDAYLKHIFGDYMKYPPLESIEQHILRIEFNKP